MILPASVSELHEALITLFASTGRVGLPAGSREEVAALLTRLMVNRELRGAYCRAVAAARVSLGVDRAMDEAGDSGDIPEREIARHGFAWPGLTGEQLADYATDPHAIEAIAERLRAGDLLGDLGDWYAEAALREQADRPDDRR